MKCFKERTNEKSSVFMEYPYIDCALSKNNDRKRNVTTRYNENYLYQTLFSHRLRDHCTDSFADSNSHSLLILAN